MKGICLIFISLSLWAKPHWNQQLVIKELNQAKNLTLTEPSQAPIPIEDPTGLEVLRIQVDWSQQNTKEIYHLNSITLDKSGSEALYRRSLNQDKLGSYRGELLDLKSKKAIYFDSVGTGMEYRLLTRSMSFRFPKIDIPMLFRMWAENPKSGVMEVVLEQEIDPENAITLTAKPTKQWLVTKAKKSPHLVITFYAEGYPAGKEEQFLAAVKRAENIINEYPFPLNDHFEIRAVYAVSNTKLNSARNLGLPVPEFDSFFGMYFPYWDNMGRWYHILYPTREQKLREGLAQAVYDYPILLVDSDDYWGVGNYNSHTALPAENHRSFQYLFIHEFGHFMGLNEEYHEPAPNRTELTFAPGIYEPWSQNTTFLRDSSKLKWKKFVAEDTPIPTPVRWWSNKIGAYKGGYSSAPGLNHKPSLNCAMDSKANFCPVCLDAIQEKIKFDLGLDAADF